MSLDFLAADLTQPYNGELPVMRSPIRSLLENAGARFRQCDRWEVLASFGDPAEEQAACLHSVGIADQSSLGKLELQADPEAVDRIATKFAGDPVRSGLAVNRDGIWWCRLRPSRLLAVMPPELTPEARAGLEGAVARSDGWASVTELTTSLGSNAVVGPLARETFARLSALDLRERELGPCGFAPGSVARVPGMVLHERDDRYLHLFGTAYAEYIWTVFLDAAESLGGRAVGTDALTGMTPAIGAADGS